MRALMLALLVVSVGVAFAIGFTAKDFTQSGPASATPTPTLDATFATAEPTAPLAVTASAKPTAGPSGTQTQTGAGIERQLTLKLPAVDKLERGSLADLIVTVRQGDGSAFSEIATDSPLVNTDTQNSFRTAVNLARKLSSNVPGSDTLDVFFSIDSNSQVVGGKSAGAAATIAALALLRDETLKPGFLITGTVDDAGTIGQVGQVLPKAQAAKNAGFTTLLVPPGESIARKAVEKCQTQQNPDGSGQVQQVCQTIIQEVRVEDETGLTVIEVDSIPKAYNLMRT